MHIPIKTMMQVARLYTGDILTQYYAEQGDSDPAFTRFNSTSYLIYAIKPLTRKMELIGVLDPLITLFAPGEKSRMFLRFRNLIDDGNWWLH